MDMWSGKKLPSEGSGVQEMSLPEKRVQVAAQEKNPNLNRSKAKNIGFMSMDNLLHGNVQAMYVPGEETDPGFARPGSDEHSFVHEGHHKLSHQIRQKYGIDVAHKFFTDLLNQAHPDVASFAHEVIAAQPAYQALSRDAHISSQLTHNEEVVNLIRDVLTDKKKRESFFRMAESAGHPFHKFDTRVKQSWQRMVDHAKNYEFKG